MLCPWNHGRRRRLWSECGDAGTVLIHPKPSKTSRYIVIAEMELFTSLESTIIKLIKSRAPRCESRS